VSRGKKTWRDLLRERLEDPVERSRIVGELNVNSSTLWRWVAPGATQKPRVAYLVKLPDLFPPRQRDEVRGLLAEEYPDVFPPHQTQKEEPLVRIPSLYYMRVLAALHDEHGLATWAALSLGLKQLASQLVGEQRETSAFVMQISPTRKTLYLRQGVTYDERRFTSSRGFELSTLFFAGAQDAPGEAVIRKTTAERHAGNVAYPLLRRGKVVGSLWIKTQGLSGFSRSQRDLAALYASLFAVVFEEHNFCSPDELHLARTPSQEQQHVTLKALSTRYCWSLIDPEKMSSLLSEIETIILQGGVHDH